VKVGDLVENRVDDTIGIVLDLGNQYWNDTPGARVLAHVQVSYPIDGTVTWELPASLEVISESR